jgi:hypothetical protein
MKLPEGVISISLFLCEKVLTERNGVMSAIRIVDVFPVRPMTPERPIAPIIRISGCALVKGKPGPVSNFKAQFKVEDDVGKIMDIGPGIDISVGSQSDDLPRGGAINLELNIEARTLGTSYLCFYLDEAEVARTPFTIVPMPENSEQVQ